MPAFAYFNTGMIRDAKTEFEIHGAGCAHLSRGDRRQFVGPHDVMTAESAEALRDSEVRTFEDQDQGWTAEDFRIFPCAK
jgi:hypothetical protein